MKKLLCLLSLLFAALSHGAAIQPPKFVLLLVIDQLRGDLIHLHRKQFSDKGFNYLIYHGIDYHNTHHPHANTATCPGHASIATGSYPALHGVVSNHWYDPQVSEYVYCMEDKNSPILPTVHTKTQPPGRSPAQLMASTISDEILLSKKGRAFAVSLKDRAAITLAGHTGKAFWFDRENGGFVSSRWYYSEYPRWVLQWNQQYQPKAITWTLSRAETSYTFAEAPRFQHPFADFGQNFPHSSGEPHANNYFKFLSMTPEADKLTADFAEQLIIEEKLGQKEGQTDYLGLGFSATDAIGHQFGPNSLESEDNLLQLDKTLAHLLAIIDKHVGLDNTLIVLTADHGVTDAPAYLKKYQLNATKPVQLAPLKQAIHQQMKTVFNLPQSALAEIAPPFIYLDHSKIEQHRIDPRQVSRFIAIHLSRYPGLYKAYPLPLDAQDKDWIGNKVAKMTYPGRAGDIYLVAHPYQSYDVKNEARVAHNGPWKYDSFVPLLFINPAFKAQTIHRAASTTDIAPTLAEILMIKPPSASVGQPLEEVLEYFSY